MTKEAEWVDMVPALKALGDWVQDTANAQALYAAMCNIIWVHVETGDEFAVTWRTAGGIVAGLRDQGENYLDFYCTGIHPLGSVQTESPVSEGDVRADIEEMLLKQGWRWKEYD